MQMQYPNNRSCAFSRGGCYATSKRILDLHTLDSHGGSDSKLEKVIHLKHVTVSAPCQHEFFGSYL